VASDSIDTPLPPSKKKKKKEKKTGENPEQDGIYGGESKIPYHGEVDCAKCKNRAYWIVADGRCMCGVHSKKEGDARKPLPKRSRAFLVQRRTEILKDHDASVEEVRKRNAASGVRGGVRLFRMRMMKNPPLTDGWMNVFPNYRHQNRKDGYGCMKLSPKSLGPVEHGQPGLPPAVNIENFHQGSKCFAEETDEAGDPSLLYYENRFKFYKDPVPHRHKYIGQSPTGNKNIPKYFVWVDREGTSHRLSYVESRQFYSNFYERLASREPDFVRLRSMVDAGTNVCICGYDATPLEEGETIEHAYMDASKPFGHERVLYAMLCFAPTQWPWRLHKTFDF